MEPFSVQETVYRFVIGCKADSTMTPNKLRDHWRHGMILSCQPTLIHISPQAAEKPFRELFIARLRSLVLIRDVLSSTREYFLTGRGNRTDTKQKAYNKGSARRGKGTATVRRSQRLPLPLAVRLACGLAFAGAFFFGRSESSESSPFV